MRAAGVLCIRGRVHAVRLAQPRYVDPAPIVVRCSRCAFVVEAPVQEAHRAFENHACAVATRDNGRANS